MKVNEQWIWLDVAKNEGSVIDCSELASPSNQGYQVVSFLKNYDFKKEIKAISLRFSADTFYRLYLNNTFLAVGPPSAGGDFLDEWLTNRSYYSTELKIDTMDEKMRQGKCEFYALVRKCPIKINEFSTGAGGFYLQAEVLFEDGTTAELSTDETWLARVENGYIQPLVYDDSTELGKLENAVRIENQWRTKTAPIPPCEEHSVDLGNKGKIEIKGNSKTNAELDFDKVYAGYTEIHSTQPVKIVLKYFETDDLIAIAQINLIHSLHYVGLDFLSVGKIEMEITNLSGESGEVQVDFWATNYPVKEEAKTITLDEELNTVLEVCAHSLKYCRQSMHLDSPKHCEPLACTGDYYIETLMTAFSFGDMRLSLFDVRRTAELLENQDGRIFHTSYSLIWVQMLWDTYMLTGERAVLYDCEKALNLLLSRFEGYIGETGLIEKAPDYMFVDWLVVDGYNLHHPPKALGQTCLNMFYYGALKTASKIYQTINSEDCSVRCMDKAEGLKCAMLKWLWDEEKGLFFEGMNTPTPKPLVGRLMPQNSEKRYFRKHANILAAYFEIFDKKENQILLKKTLEDTSLGEVQPYFMHYLLEAVYRNGLREVYTLPLLEQWKAPIKECPKGLPEGFYPPDPSYCFDHSHAWAGTPLYALPLALSGLKIEKAGFKKISLAPSLCGLKYAKIEIPTPYGMVKLSLQENEEPSISVPKEIDFQLNI